jgi:hypothetical protein
MSQSRSGRLQSGTTPRAWYCPITSVKVIPAFRRRQSTAQWDLSIFSCSALVRPHPIPLRLRDGAADIRRKRVLGVFPQVEPRPVPAAIRAGQRRWDVVVAAALLHPKVGAANRRRAGSLPQAGEPEEVTE